VQRINDAFLCNASMLLSGMFDEELTTQFMGAILIHINARPKECEIIT
jgi:hypothetical protein